MEQRFTELETRITFQDDTIQALNEVVTQQQQQIEQLKLQIAALKEKIESPSQSLMVEQDEKPPPHY